MVGCYNIIFKADQESFPLKQVPRLVSLLQVNFSKTQ